MEIEVLSNSWNNTFRVADVGDLGVAEGVFQALT